MLRRLRFLPYCYSAYKRPLTSPIDIIDCVSTSPIVQYNIIDCKNFGLINVLCLLAVKNVRRGNV